MVRTCPSCDMDLPTGNRFCGTCGAPVKAEPEQLHAQEWLMRRHAEALGQWLEPEVKRSPISRRALLACVGILVVAGAYLAFRGIAEAVGTSGGTPGTERAATMAAESP